MFILLMSFMEFHKVFPRSNGWTRDTGALKRQGVRRNACHLVCPSTPMPTLILIEKQRLIKPTHDTNPTQALDAPSLTPKMASRYAQLIPQQDVDTTSYLPELQLRQRIPPMPTATLIRWLNVITTISRRCRAQ